MTKGEAMTPADRARTKRFGNLTTPEVETLILALKASLGRAGDDHSSRAHDLIDELQDLKRKLNPARGTFMITSFTPDHAYGRGDRAIFQLEQSDGDPFRYPRSVVLPWAPRNPIEVINHRPHLKGRLEVRLNYNDEGDSILISYLHHALENNEPVKLEAAP